MRARQCAICGDSASVRWMVLPRSWTIRFTSSLLPESVRSIVNPGKLWGVALRDVKGGAPARATSSERPPHLEDESALVLRSYPILGWPHARARRQRGNRRAHGQQALGARAQQRRRGPCSHVLQEGD